MSWHSKSFVFRFVELGCSAIQSSIFAILFVCTDIYKTIYEIHSEPKKYTFGVQARKVYEAFSDDIVNEMNRQLQEDVIVEDNMSKDRKIFVR